MIRQLLREATAGYRIALSEEQIEQFAVYYDLLVSWNEKINLTAITDPQGVAVKHFADSLSVFNYIEIPENARVIDVGTGAGFPGLAMKLARPDLRLTLLDSLQKRLHFLSAVCDALHLDVQLIHSRAEDGGQSPDLREQYDLAVSRAVARLNVLSEYCLPYVSVGGSFVAFKADAAEEIKQAKNAVAILGGSIAATHSFDLPMDGGSRTLVEIKKIKPTSKQYPRANGKIKSKPL